VTRLPGETRCGKVPAVDTELRDSAGRPVRVEVVSRTAGPPQPLPPCLWEFPDVRRAPARGCVGEGADFTPSTIVTAYRHGVFPWPQAAAEKLWFSPDPRAVIPLDGLHISRRLGRTLRMNRFTATVDADFESVMRACASGRPEGTWITSSLIEGYVALHRLGWAHSVEVWTQAGDLAGGLYGVGVGAMFGAESMFHRVRDASKVALVALTQHLIAIGMELLDVQVVTEHTASMGVIEIPRREYMERLTRAIRTDVDWSKRVRPAGGISGTAGPGRLLQG